MRANALANLLLILAIYGVTIYLAAYGGAHCLEWLNKFVHLDTTKRAGGIISLALWMVISTPIYVAVRFILVRVLLEEDKRDLQ